jgi:hypothetical protein
LVTFGSLTLGFKFPPHHQKSKYTMARSALQTNLDTSAIASKNLSRLLSRLDQKLDSGATTTRIERGRIAAVSIPELVCQ